MLTITVHEDQEPKARALAESLTPDARLSYALGGTLKYELPKDQVCVGCVRVVLRIDPHSSLSLPLLSLSHTYDLQSQVHLSSVFKAVHAAKEAGLQMEDWAVTSATLEEVFIRLAAVGVTDDTRLE